MTCAKGKCFKTVMAHGGGGGDQNWDETFVANNIQVGNLYVNNQDLTVSDVWALY